VTFTRILPWVPILGPLFEVYLISKGTPYLLNFGTKNRHVFGFVYHFYWTFFVLFVIFNW